jgi:dihydroneopterin aldolase/2-amino-4-hydroxy-6-hydroxymethyldihydropteridine diphosphokinase
MSDAVTVLIRGLEVFGRHGVFAAEQELGQQFVVDVELELISCPGVATDDLEDTVDYATLADGIARIVAGPPRRLLEHVAGEIADLALAERLAHRVVVEVRKPHVALPHTVTDTAVRLVRHRASTYWLGLGANQGDRLANLQGLVDALRDGGVEVEQISPVYDTAPRELTDQPPFLNAVVRVRTTLEPPALLAIANGAERRLGRTGGGVRFGPRPADCDIVFWNRGEWREPNLQIPHPRLAERRFVLVPLLDVSDGLVHPDGRAIAEIAAGLDADEQPVRPWSDGVLG